MKTNPTRTQFDAYSLAYAYFNRNLFGGKLPNCILNFSRKAGSAGFFAPHRWTRRNGSESTHEISLNPDVLELPPIETMQTLVHEMVHLWQQEFGLPSRRTYHNTEWAEKMQDIGLMPSETGQPGGKKTGQKMCTYVVDGGPFAKAFESMPEKALLPWLARPFAPRPQSGGQKRDQMRYQCPECKAIVRGKDGLNIMCGDCNEAFTCNDASGHQYVENQMSKGTLD
jgi:hypothetical protein